MNKEHEIPLNIKHEQEMLITSEYFGIANPQYFLIHSELRGKGTTTLFLLGVDQILLSVQATQKTKEEITSDLYRASTQSIAEFIEEKGIIRGNTYYGEYLQNGTFEIGAEKPVWEDGNWGQKINNI